MVDGRKYSIRVTEEDEYLDDELEEGSTEGGYNDEDDDLSWIVETILESSVKMDFSGGDDQNDKGEEMGENFENDFGVAIAAPDINTDYISNDEMGPANVSPTEFVATFPRNQGPYFEKVLIKDPDSRTYRLVNLNYGANGPNDIWFGRVAYLNSSTRDVHQNFDIEEAQQLKLGLHMQVDGSASGGIIPDSS